MAHPSRPFFVIRLLREADPANFGFFRLLREDRRNKEDRNGKAAERIEDERLHGTASGDVISKLNHEAEIVGKHIGNEKADFHAVP